MDQLNGKTLLYPIIGDPILYVESPQRLTEVFAEKGHNGICIPMQVADAKLESVLHGLQDVPNVRGLLVTMPHKNTMFSRCATSSAVSKLLGVVSVARRNPDGTWHGDMLDGIAFVASLKSEGALLEGARVLQIGAGGVGSAIAVALLDAGVRELVLNDVNRQRAEEILALLSHANGGQVTFGPPDPTGFDIVVNATPMGMADDDPLPVPAHLLTSSMFVGDVIAGHGTTAFIKAAREAGCKSSDGSNMVRAVMKIMPEFFLAR